MIASDVDPYEIFARFYDESYPDDFYLRYFEFIVTATGIQPSERVSILDIACGTGRLLSHFKRCGCSVCGVDVSAAMAGRAKQQSIPVTVADMRSFDLDDRFDLVLCTFDSLNYLSELEDLSRTFRVVTNHLNHGGWFILDMITPYKIDVRVPSFNTTYRSWPGRDVIWLSDHQPGIWTNTLIVFEKISTGYQRFEESHCSYAFSLDDVFTALGDAGLRHCSVYGSDNMDPIDEQTERWYFVCSH